MALGLPLDDELLLDEDELLEELVLDELEEELVEEDALLELLVLALEELLVLDELLEEELVGEVPPQAANNNKAMDAGNKDRIMGGFPCCWVGFIRIV